jgi:hypothetical protein
MEVFATYLRGYDIKINKYIILFLYISLYLHFPIDLNSKFNPVQMKFLFTCYGEKVTVLMYMSVLTFLLLDRLVLLSSYKLTLL